MKAQLASTLLLAALLCGTAPAQTTSQTQTQARTREQQQQQIQQRGGRQQAQEPLAVRGETVYTMTGQPIRDGVVLVRGGRIERVGPAAGVQIPAGYRTLSARVVTPGLVDAHTVVGLAGYLNQPHDQDQVERSAAMQPELRAIDAYNPREELVSWLRRHGVTTIHTGHGPGALISGGTMIAKTWGDTADEAVVVPDAMIAVTLGPDAYAAAGRAPGTRAKEIALLRQELIRAQEAVAKGGRAEGATTRPGDTAGGPDPAAVPRQPNEQVGARGTTDTTTPVGRPAESGGGQGGAQAGGGDSTARDLRREALMRVVRRETPLLVTAHRAQDIVSALRLAREFNIRVVLDGAAEGYLVADEIRRAGVPVIVHPTMYRAAGEAENLSMETPATLRRAGITVALQSGFENYVPKTRVVLFEAAVAAANGLRPEEALALVTSDAARLLGISDRVGSLEAGKDADLALFDGDPFEYMTRVTGVVINGRVVSEEAR
ncbi:MAG TPA: amidohydrolase family protein [Pyrinomonadaceae bacterium]|nr:amidohydrolase family protein [Pyrinomonadaceae bacterium]